ncbi:hypothetical protein OC835_000768 [Tilletia horrida]|nr:hypothetical protein OC835_000768 [Tilletia horrida]
MTASSSSASITSATPGAALPGFSKVKNGRRYQLVVVQQPSRARMCGFGDKDRRPLSPTLIVKLVIYDAASGRELHPSEVNTSLFFVTSDLCHPDDLMLAPRNILVHHGGSGLGFPGQAPAHAPGLSSGPGPGPGPAGFSSSSSSSQPQHNAPIPSPSLDGSMMSGIQEGSSRSPSGAAAAAAGTHFDPHTQTHVYAPPIPDLSAPGPAHHSFQPSMPNQGLLGVPDPASWSQSVPSSSASASFLPPHPATSAYGMPGIGGGISEQTMSMAGFAPASQPSMLSSGFDPNTGMPAGPSSSSSATAVAASGAYPVASGMAGAYLVGDPPSTPSSATLPGSAGAGGFGSMAMPGSNPLMGPPIAGYDFHATPGTLPPTLGSGPSSYAPQPPTSLPPSQPHYGAASQAAQPHSQPTPSQALPSSSSMAGSGSTTTAPTFPPLGAHPFAPPQQLYHSPSLFPPSAPLTSLLQSQSLSSDNLTRNLVGSAVASANVLKDLDDRVCIFFVLQDISVRTEGVYRIKLMFADLGLNGTVNRGISEALAETYTDAFVVYSPRKFPGMHDPTELSRKLVAQGVKIPVRSDRKKHSSSRGGTGHSGGGSPGSGPGPGASAGGHGMAASSGGGGGGGGAEGPSASGAATAGEEEDVDDD